MTLVYQTESTYEQVHKSKKKGQEIALKRRIKFSNYNKRQAKKYWKKKPSLSRGLGSINWPDLIHPIIIDV
jgi:hypothetical protein